MILRPLLIGSDIYRISSYGRQHPLAIPRVSTVIDLVRALGWLAPEAYVESPRASLAALSRFHDSDYLAALLHAEAEQRVAPETARRFNIGCNGNPVFPEIFARPATSCGASLAAADLLLEGRATIVYNPAGGTHHGQRDRASGFCYLNDCVLAILRFLDGGARRVLYVDLDAHHGDGVQDAFADEPRVTMVSIHESGRWPFSGGSEERGCGNVVNLPVPAGFNDDEMELLVAEVVLPFGEAAVPEFIVVQCGADALAEDPLSRLALSNGPLWRAVAALRRLAGRHGAGLLLLGGGGYNPWSVGRCWAGNWAVLNEIVPPAVLPPAGEAVLRALSWSRSAGRNPPGHWFTTLADAPRPGSIRDEVRRLAERVRPHPSARTAAYAEAS